MHVAPAYTCFGEGPDHFVSYIYQTFNRYYILMGTNPMHMHLLYRYAHFKSGPTNAHSKVTHFFIDEPSHIYYNVIQEEGQY
jgi:hypothetical protein